MLCYVLSCIGAVVQYVSARIELALPPNRDETVVLWLCRVCAYPCQHGCGCDLEPHLKGERDCGMRGNTNTPLTVEGGVCVYGSAGRLCGDQHLALDLDLDRRRDQTGLGQRGDVLFGDCDLTREGLDL